MRDILIALMGTLFVVGGMLSAGFILVMMERGRKKMEINETIKQIHKGAVEHRKPKMEFYAIRDITNDQLITGFEQWVHCSNDGDICDLIYKALTDGGPAFLYDDKKEAEYLIKRLEKQENYKIITLIEEEGE